MLLIIQTQIIAQEYWKIIAFTLPLLNLVFLQCGLQEILSFLECHPTCQFRMLFLQVLDVVYYAVRVENRDKRLCKIISQYTVIHIDMYIMIFTAQHSMFANWKQWNPALHDLCKSILCSFLKMCCWSSVELAHVSFTNHHNTVLIIKYYNSPAHLSHQSFARDLVYWD